MLQPDRVKEATLSICCPICQSVKFQAFNGRENARCLGCLSVERTRLLWMVLERLDIIKPGIRVLHFAPELPLLMRFHSLLGDRYHPCDLDPLRYKSRYCHIFPINMCQDLQKMPSELFDLIIHNHVLEHICCSVEDTLVELNRIMKKNSHHFFTVFFGGATTIEDLSPSLTGEQRSKQFGQHDHVRSFGKEDFPALLKRVWNVPNVTVSVKSLFSETVIERAGIPLKSLEEIDANTIFHHIK
ncbi:hypothetical protein QUA35_10110 [Microcoleus sp. N9_B2]|uniref:hypothetical protein n=1 Tax=unclassified Microcoleus TaxID=2642155 RepID=UPI002FD1F3F9